MIILSFLLLFLSVISATSPIRCRWPCPRHPKPPGHAPEHCQWEYRPDNFCGCNGLFHLKCDPPPVDACHQNVDRGTCDQLLARWFFSPKTNKCLSFRYGGCGGNENKFDTKQECEKRCLHSYTGGGTCSQASDRGTCDKLITRWFYSSKVGRCLTFQYGGCDGNTNNFATKEECEKFCTLHKDDPNLCARVRCGACQECKVNKLGQAKCVRQTGCCSAPSQSVTCDVDPCQFSKRDCRQSAFCISSHCNGCHAYYYDNFWNELPKAKCKKECVIRPLAVPRHGCFYQTENGPDDCPVYTMVCNKKPGRCPPLSRHTHGVCLDECNDDNECQGSRKCCSNGCGHVCTSPIIRCPPFFPISSPPLGCYYRTDTGSDHCPRFRLVCDTIIT